jgi:tRNA (cmo5U34)-methyltransferase
MSWFVLQKYPEARLTLIDLSENMLDVARRRFSAVSGVSYIAEDYLSRPFGKSFDAVVSALSIHHLSDRDKVRLYRKCFDALREDGVFVNADQVRGHTPWLESVYRNDWRSAVERSGLTRQELDSAYRRVALDRMAALDDQLRWLRDSGFADVDCVYKHHSFVVLFGRKVGRDRR